MPSIAWPVWFSVVLAIDTMSWKPMATASELFLVRFRYWLVIGGMMTRSACGSTIWRSTAPRRRPSAPAASHWPSGTAWMPERTISAI